MKFNKQFGKSVFKKYIFLLAFVLLAAASFGGYGIYKSKQSAQAASCDSNNIVYCGVNMGNLYSAYNSLDGVGRSAYNHAGVQSSKFNQLKPCVIHKNGTVTVNGAVVADNAFTYGRQNITRPGVGGSTQIPGGAYMRTPAVSFAAGVQSINSYCYMDGQEFKWGIIGECGNPIKATPRHKNNPKGTLTKTVNKDVVKIGEVFTYTLTLKNVGNVALKDVVLKDLLPPGIKMANGINENPRIFRFGTINPGETKVIKLDVKAVPGSAYDVRLRNLACFTSNYNPDLPICDDAYVIIRKDEPKQPNIKIEKDVSTAAPVAIGEPFTYTIKVTNNGDQFLKNVRVTDTLPDGVVAVNNPNDRTVTFTLSGLKKGASQTFSFQAKVVSGPDQDVELINTACVETDEIPNKKCDDATVRVKVPTYSCTMLQSQKISDRNYRFGVTYSATNGAVLKNVAYNFGDGSPVVVVNGTVADHQFPANTGNTAAQYNVKAVLTFTVNGQDKVVDSPACRTQISVPPVVQTPVYTCDGLVINKISDVKYSFTTSLTAQNGAVLKNIAYNFGDGSEVLNTLQTTVEHTYAQPGQYNASAVLTFTVNGEDKVVASDSCKATTDQPPVVPKCPIPGKEHLPKDSPDCKEVPPVTPPETPETPVEEQPTTIPDTGAGQIAGMFLSTVAAGMVAYRLVWLRRYN